MTASLPDDPRTANWEFLWRQLEAGPLHQTVITALSRLDDSALAVVLRHHEPERVTDPAEIRFRATVDEWLGQVELLYVAWLCGYVPDPAEQDQAATLRTLLDRPPLRVYYERHYPVPLPWLFRLHLEGSVRLEPTTAADAAGAFERFASLYERFRGDESLGEFLNFLDSFSYGSEETRVDIRAVVAAFELPERIAEAFQRPAGSMSHLDRGIVGLVRFLTFSEDLDNLLQRCQTMPVVQSTFWFFYGYWFTEFGAGVTTQSTNAVDKILGAVRSDPTSDVHRRARAAEHAGELKLIVKRLTGGDYVRPLYDEVARSVRERPNESGSSPEEWLERFAHYLPTPGSPT